MATVGDQLRGERERRGLQRVDVARATRIYIHHLAALEHGNLDELPDEGIVRGYVRAYAEYLDLDPGAVVAEFLRERGIDDGEPELPRAEELETRPALSAMEPMTVVASELDDTPEAATQDAAELRPGAEPQAPAEPERRRAVDTNPGLEPEPEPARASEPESRPASADRPEPERAAESPRSSPKGTFPEPTGEGLLGPVPLFRSGAGGARKRNLAWVAVPFLLIVAIVAVWWSTRERPEPAVETEPVPVQGEVEQPAPVEPAPVSTSVEESLRDESPAEGSPPPVETPVEATSPTVEPRVETQSTRTAATLNVIEYGVGTGIVDRRLAGESERFDAGSRVYFWTRVTGGTPGDRIRHVWLHEGAVVQTIDLRIGGPHWRTHSFKTPYETGRWTVEARDQTDNLLARSTFLCVR